MKAIWEVNRNVREFLPKTTLVSSIIKEKQFSADGQERREQESDGCKDIKARQDMGSPSGRHREEIAGGDIGTSLKNQHTK